MVLQVASQDAFNQQLEAAGDKAVVIDFFATWCGPCKVIAPEFVRLSEIYTNAVFLKVDVDELEELASEYDISSLPTFLILKGGKKLDMIVGGNKEALEEMVAKHCK